MAQIVRPDRRQASQRHKSSKALAHGAEFLALLKMATAPHKGCEIHVMLDNLSAHTTPDVRAWLEKNPHVTFHFAPVGSSWLNQIETWFGLITNGPSAAAPSPASAH